MEAIFEGLVKNITKYQTFSEEELAYFTSLFQIREFPKKEIILKEGEICDFEGYIVKGCAKGYMHDGKMNEVILTLAIEDWWISDIVSFTQNKPSRIYLETLEPTTLLVIRRDQKELLSEKYPRFEKVFRRLMENHLAAYQDRMFKSIACPTKMRYIEFMDKHPELLQRVPQHLIASYLGVSPEFLSKVRKEIATQK